MEAYPLTLNKSMQLLGKDGTKHENAGYTWTFTVQKYLNDVYNALSIFPSSHVMVASSTYIENLYNKVQDYAVVAFFMKEYILKS